MKFIILLLLFNSPVARGDIILAGNPKVGPVAFAGGDATVAAYGGDGKAGLEATAPADISSESTPLVVYVPIDDGNGNDGTTTIFGYDTPSFSSVNEILPLVTSTVPATFWDDDAYIMIHLQSNNGSRTSYVATQAADGNFYTMFVANAHGPTMKTSLDVVIGGTTSLYLNFEMMCVDTSKSKCGFVSGNVYTKGEQLLYIFYEDLTSYGNRVKVSDADINKGTNFQGVYVKVMFSSESPNVATDFVSGYKLKKGDEQLILEYDGTNLSAFFPETEGFKTLAFLYDTNAGGTAAQTLAAARGGAPEGGIDRLLDFQQKGPHNLTNLVNGREYTVSVALVNLYQQVSILPIAQSQTPVEILTFLREQSCYFISAGFQEEHYVIEYFKRFRDEVLSGFSWGKKFIHYYYATAPQYAHFIFESDWLSFVVRSFSYALYYFMKHFVIFLSMLAGIICCGLILGKLRRNTINS